MQTPGQKVLAGVEERVQQTPPPRENMHTEHGLPLLLSAICNSPAHHRIPSATCTTRESGLEGVLPPIPKNFKLGGALQQRSFQLSKAPTETQNLQW